MLHVTSVKLKTIILLVAIAIFKVDCAFSYGFLGHKIVGAIADEKLSGKPVEKKIQQLLGDVSLASAANLPDAMKDWDKEGPDAPKAFHLTSNLELNTQLRAFWYANPPTTNYNSAIPSHRWFHYTDVPVFNFGKYADGKTGRSAWDIVNMMSYCIRVLKGEESEQNARKITKPVAIVLLAHYVGDIHQPLHVGAGYYDTKGKPVNPDKGVIGVCDNGGNGLSFKYSIVIAKKRILRSESLHSFWDGETVMLVLNQIRAEIRKQAIGNPLMVMDEEIVDYFVSQEPKNWRLNLSTDIDHCAQQWADEILPVASQAYERLRFIYVKPHREGSEMIAKGQVVEKLMPDGIIYNKWASNVVKEQLHKAGWRLAELLEKALQ